MIKLKNDKGEIVCVIPDKCINDIIQMDDGRFMFSIDGDIVVIAPAPENI